MPTLIRLRWPPRELSPNARLHYRAKASAVASYRNECFYDARSQGLGRLPGDSLSVRITFHPPADGRRRDRDNMVSSAKAACDAIASLTGIDDFNWRTEWCFGEPVDKGLLVLEVLP